MQDEARGIVMIAFGEKALVQMNLAKRDLTWPLIEIVTNETGLPDKHASRSIKTNLLRRAHYDDTLYLDADTRVQGDITAGFEALEAGWDMALSFSDRQDGDAFWHVSDEENEMTLRDLGYSPLQWQCGVMFVRDNPRTQKFFEEWHKEWWVYHDEDQAAFVRALHRVPLKIWVLGRSWNGGAVIQHKFGACR